MVERNARIEEEPFPFYARDALTDEERAEVEAYVAGNPEARARLLAALDAAAVLGMMTAPAQPSPAVKDRLMARVAADTSPQTPSRAPSPADRPANRPTHGPRRGFDLRRFYVGRALGFAALLILLGAFGLWRLWQQTNVQREQLVALEERADALQDELDQLRAANEALQAELAARDEVLAQFRQPGAVTVTIGDASGENPDVIGLLTLNAAAGEATLAVANLPPPPAGTTYQAWLIVGETPISAGTFDVGPTGSAVHPLPNAVPGAFDAVGVSLEPSGGSETPTSDSIILLGTVDS